MKKAKRRARTEKEYIWIAAKDAEQPTHYESLVLNLARMKFAYTDCLDMDDCLELAIEAVAVTEKWLKQRRKK